MDSKKPIAILMAAAMTVASLSAVSLYADDVVNNDTVILENTTASALSDPEETEPDIVVNDNPNQPSNGENDINAAKSDTTATEPDPALKETDPPAKVTDPPVYFNELSTGVLKGYLEMPHAPSSLKGNSISAFEENMKCVSVAGHIMSGANNNLDINIDTITGDMVDINGRAKAYPILYRFDKDSVITCANLTTTDITDGQNWKSLYAPDDDYQYIVVWYNAAIPATSIVFREEKIVDNKKVYTDQTIRVLRRDTTPIDPSVTTTKAPETTTAPVEFISEISTDWPLKTTISDRRGTVNLAGLRVMVDPCNEVFLNASSRFPYLVNAIKNDKAYSYNIKLEKDNTDRALSGSFKVTIALPERIKSSNSIYLYRASGSYYTPIEIMDQKSGEVSFVTYELGIRLIISTVELEGYMGETTTATGTATGTGTASPLITAGAGSALSNADIMVYSNATLPNGTRLQITSLDTAQSNNKAVELAISEGKALAYDIKLVNAMGAEMSQANVNAVSVSFDVPSQFSGNNTLYVYRRESNDTFTNMNANVSGGKLRFVTQHLSTYIVSTVAFDGSAVNTGSTGSVVTTTKSPNNNGGNNGGGSQVIINGGGNSGTNNPGTGFLFAIVPVGLAAAGIAITRKKKR